MWDSHLLARTADAKVGPYRGVLLFTAACAATGSVAVLLRVAFSVLAAGAITGPLVYPFVLLAP